MRFSFPRQMGLSALALAAFSAAAGTTIAAGPTATIIEFHNAAQDQYFITASPAEAAALDAGSANPGWTRTGVEWKAWGNATEMQRAVPVCRFAATAGTGPGSHYYTASTDECRTLKQNRGWKFEGHAFWIELPGGTSASRSCRAGTTPVYRSYHAGNTPAEGNYRLVTDLTLHVRMAGSSTLQGVVMCSPLSSAQIDADISRLLEQATWGPNEALIAHVRQRGVTAFVDEQLALPSTRYTAFPPVPNNRPDTCVDDRTLPLTPGSFCARDNYTLFQLQREFLRNAVQAPDQLRQRVAFALSQILVTSGTDINKAYAMQRYQQLLADLAFGNFLTVLTEVTLSPAMGNYLDMANNRKPHAATGIEPNENYARELMQLFSIGTVELAPDGTPLHDAQGKPIATYDQDEIEGYAHVFTGWTYPTTPGATSRLQNGPYFDGRMEERGALHDYGAGVRGDLGAVVRAILLDPEARGATKLDPGYGKLREPAKFVAGAARALGASTDGVFFRAQTGTMGQPVFMAPSVFNYYPPDYVVPGTTALGPEFAIQNTSSALARANFANTLAFAAAIAPDRTVYGATGTQIDWAPWAALAGTPAALVDRLDRLLTHGTLSAAAKGAIETAIAAVPATDPPARAKTAFYLFLTSSQYQVER